MGFGFRPSRKIQNLLNLKLNLYSKVTENRHWHFLGKRNYLSDPPWKNFSLSVHGLHWLCPRELPCHLANEVRLALWLFTQISSNMKDDSFSLIFKEYFKFWKSYALNYRRSKMNCATVWNLLLVYCYLKLTNLWTKFNLYFLYICILNLSHTEKQSKRNGEP